MIIISICLLVCSCGSKKTKTDKDTNEDKIDLQLGTEDMVFTEESLVCGNYNVQSKITFNQDGTASYEFYDCQDNNIILESSEGTYSSDDLEVTLTNNYEENFPHNFKILS